MSNPAVIKLASTRIGNSKVWLDDNYGESIHIHIDDIRIDLTTMEFKQLYFDLCDTLNELINVEGFDAHTIDPVYLSVMLWPRLSKLKKVSFGSVSLKDMLAPSGPRIDTLEESRGYLSLIGTKKEKEVWRKSHHIKQTDTERLHSALTSLKENGYPYQKQYIIMYGDDNVIRDGQHRASCLLFLYGNIEVPVMRLYFNDYSSPILKHYNRKDKVLIRKYKPKLSALIKSRSLKKSIIEIIKMLTKFFSSINRKKLPSVDNDILYRFNAK